MMRTWNRTKLVATVGPACRKPEEIKALVNNGVSVFRINCSHGDHADHISFVSHIRQVNDQLHTHCAIMFDLQGPKIRLGRIENDEFRLPEGGKLTLTTRKCIGNKDRVHISYSGFPKDVKKGDKVLLDDGKIELVVLTSNGRDEVQLRALNAGRILSNKGVNLPDTLIGLPSLTSKDLRDLELAIELKADWIALSFVRSARDVVQLRKILRKRNCDARIISKIEKPQAIAHLDEIISASDAVMIARGDLGVEMPIENVPMIQKKIANKCIKAARPVIIATQMMESMIEQPYPTRAEVTDVANAIIDGADAVMLSGETAVGRHPAKVVEMMQKIIRNIETETLIYNKDLTADRQSKTFLSDAICYNACKIAADVEATAIIGMTVSGYTAFMASSYRPMARIFIFSNKRSLLTVLNLVWGVVGFFYDKMESTDQTFEDVQQILKKDRLVRKGDVVVNMASMPLHSKGRTNTVKVTVING